MKLKSFLLSLAALAPFSLWAQNQLTITNLSFQDVKSFKQVGPRDFEFDGGEWVLAFNDGVFALAPCFIFIDDDGAFTATSPVFIPPVIGCPLGTTGFVTAGDLDGDGLRDGRGFISVAPIPVPFQLVPPSRSDEIGLEAAPISQLPRPLSSSAWTDDTVTIWYDYVTRPIQAFDFTSYNFSRPYGPSQGELQRMYSEIVPGNYIFNFPRSPRGLTERQSRVPFPIPVAHRRNMVEAFPGRGITLGSNLFFLENDRDWRDGELLVDPRTGYQFDWNGLSGLHLLPGDTLDFSIIEPITEQIIFPFFTPDVPDANRAPQRLDLPSNNFQLGVGFFTPGEIVTAQLTYTRNLSSSGISTDNSQRNFEWDIRFVDSYPGFIDSNDFAIQLNADQQRPDFDFDGDGFDNVTEFALLTDPFNPAESPLLRPVIDPITLRCEYEIPKRQETMLNLQYQVEVADLAPDGQITNFRIITENDPEWAIVADNIASYAVVSRTPRPSGACILRPRVTFTDQF